MTLSVSSMCNKTRRFRLIAAALLVSACSMNWTHSTPRAAEPARLTVEEGVAHHRVAAGQTVYRIAQLYGVEMDALIAENGLAAPYTLAIDQRLRIPLERTHIVADGDTLFSISQDNGVTVASMSALNGVYAPYTIHSGQVLTLPPTAAGGPVATARAGTGSGGMTPAALPPAGQLPAPPAGDGTGFIWPVEGRLVSSFGPKADGSRNDGVNIAAPRGAAIRAAEAGTVVYAGDTIPGLGNLLLLKHQSGVITAYGHTEALLVSRGDTVAKGQVVARIGSTGSVASPQLHFQIRRSGTAVDPEAFIAGR